jgi:predicted nucleotidyltransferase
MNWQNSVVKSDLLRAMRERLPVWCRDGVLAGYRGSAAHGTYVPVTSGGIDDVDIFQVFIHPKPWYYGLQAYVGKTQRHYDTSGEQVDVQVYEIQKFMHLIEKGNPNVHNWLWTQPKHYLVRDGVGEMLIRKRRDFLSKRNLVALGGYAYAQIKKMEAFQFEGYMGEKRKALVKEFGYDCKNAAHAVRLLMQGCMLARDEELTVFMPLSHRNVIMSVKQGEWTLEKVKEYVEHLEEEFDHLQAMTKLPESVPREVYDSVLAAAMNHHWDNHQ